MRKDKIDAAELEYLEKLLDGELDPGDPIEQRLLNDSALRRVYRRLAVERCAFREALKLHAMEDALEAGMRKAPTSERRMARRGRSARRSIMWLLSLAAAAAVLAGVFILSEKPEGRIRPDGRQVARHPIIEIPPINTAVEDAPIPGGEDLVVIEDLAPQAEGPEGDVDLAGIPETLPEDYPADGLLESEPVIAEHAAPIVDVGETRTATAGPVARMTNIGGTVSYRRGEGKWFKASAGVRFLEGDSVYTRSGQASIAFADGTILLSARQTMVTFGSAGIRLGRGEIYCVPAPRSGAFSVDTPDGTVRHLGTRYGVNAMAYGTTVTVEEGKVQISNEKGLVDLGEGYQCRILSGAAPGRPMKVDVNKALGWTRDNVFGTAAWLTKGLVGYWAFDEGSGLTAQDSAAPGNHGTINGAVWCKGIKGGALRFDGNGDYVAVGNPGELQITGAMTLVAWVNVRSFESNGRIVCKQAEPGNRGWSLNVEDLEVFTIQIPLNKDKHVGAITPKMPTGKWTHLAGVYRPGRAISIFVNGQLAGESAEEVPEVQYNSPLDVWIGGRPNGSCYFDGIIDEVRIYNRPLDQGEILALYSRALEEQVQ
ncbi:MAG: FecR domain-containing protein [Planctomycetes bacterium]|nr:FecR domain-containing protein [Planctomycetota bacterium]